MANPSPLIWKEIFGNELYVYYCGNLIYKKWLNTGVDRVFYEGEGLHQKFLQRGLVWAKHVAEPRNLGQVWCSFMSRKVK